ncbi:MAG: hypothetical protein GX897_04980 [Clostridiales bacterium]|nr:hypothetical protein [Clostridiales bacterium]
MPKKTELDILKPLDNNSTPPEGEEKPTDPLKRSPDELLSTRITEDRFKYIIPVFCALIGTVMLIGAKYFAQALAWLCCGLFIFTGILMLFGIRLPSRRRGENIDQKVNYAIYSGSWLIILGIAFAARADTIIQLVPVLFGSIISLLGVVKFRLISSVKRLWFSFAAAGYFSLAVGILLIIIPGEAMSTVYLIGIVFIAEALVDTALFISADVIRARESKPDYEPLIKKRYIVWIIRAAVTLILVGLTVLAAVNLSAISRKFANLAAGGDTNTPAVSAPAPLPEDVPADVTADVPADL